VLLSIDVRVPKDEDLRVDYANVRSYFVWEFGKVPDVVVEIVSNRKGGEMQRKMKEYEQMHIPYYIVYDPFGEIQHRMNAEALHIYELHGSSYRLVKDFWLETVGIGLRLWDGVYEDCRATWLRWCDERGRVFPTGAERILEVTSRAEAEKSRADEEKLRAEAEKSRADEEKLRAEAEKSRADRLAARMRELGINPDE
jgi:hypothetical protein